MIFIEPSVDMVFQKGYTPAAINDIIEECGRICYQSADKIKLSTHEDDIDIPEGMSISSQKFVDMLLKRKHYAMLEHGTVYMDIKVSENPLTFEPISSWDLTSKKIAEFYIHNPYSKVTVTRNPDDFSTTYHITTNVRVLVENDRMKNMEAFWVEPGSHHLRRHTVKYICDRITSQSCMRYRKMSPAQESTRYCCYTKEQFDSQLTCVRPYWCDGVIPYSEYKYHRVGKERVLGRDKRIVQIKDRDHELIRSCVVAEESYMNLINKYGCKAEEARDVLPFCTKTEFVMTGFLQDWYHIFEERIDGVTGRPHPAINYLMVWTKHKFLENNITI